MRAAPRITVAPNGARLQKSNHARVPISAADLAETGRACRAAGADDIHLHVRDTNGAHSLDPVLYRAALKAISRAAPGMTIQITTEAAGRYDVPEQWTLLRVLKPAAASIAVREIARTPALAGQVYATALEHSTQVQHILYGTRCLDRLLDWRARGIVPAVMRDVLLVLGQYTPPRAGRPDELGSILKPAREAGLQMTVCAFGPEEQACLLAAADLGCDVRVGFENNLLAPNGSPWADNAQAVASFKAAHAARKVGCLA